jgi:glycosyltransferase involved in cell wall biosynthesis
MGKLVTIGIPIYKRLEYLPHVLDLVARQDYPDIELLISDNGMNGVKVLEIVRGHCSRSFKFRQNDIAVGLSKHFNQIVHAASGHYFVMLQDDDEISPNYVSELVARMEQQPRATVAISRQEIIDETGAKLRESAIELPGVVSGAEFIRDTWRFNKYKFECLATFLARTREIKSCGGYPEFSKGTHSDDALLIKLTLDSYVAFSSKGVFRYRAYETSHGWSLNIWDLAADSRQFLQFLNNDPVVWEFSLSHPDEWRDLKEILVRMAWRTYFYRWRGMYRERLRLPTWVAAAFALPPIPGYYRNVGRSLGAEMKGFLRSIGPSIKVK